MRSPLVLTATLLLFSACSKGAADAPGGFDQRWATLAAQGSQAFFVEDDRGGQRLMGSVLGAQAGAVAMAPALSESFKGGGSALPDTPDAEQVRRLITQYLPGVKSCYQRITRDGESRSGKAIVSFQIAGSGHVQGLEIAAPAFEGTSLSGCINAQVARWSFPASRKGLAAVSYPFVFVGG